MVSILPKSCAKKVFFYGNPFQEKVNIIYFYKIMREFHKIINILDSLPNNKTRKEYLESIRKNPNIARHDLMRVSCNILIQNNFIDRYYRIGFREFLKTIGQQMIEFFEKFTKK